MLSRATSSDRFGSLIAYPAGPAVAGPVAAAAGTGPVMVLVGVLEVAGVAAMLAARSVRSLRDPPAVPAVP